MAQPKANWGYPGLATSTPFLLHTPLTHTNHLYVLRGYTEALFLLADTPARGIGEDVAQSDRSSDAVASQHSLSGPPNIDAS